MTGNNTPAANYWALMAGSFLMGFGFVIADGCYIGSLWKAGQGKIASLISVVGIFLGGGISLAVQNAHLQTGAFSGSPTVMSWPITSVKIGLALFILVWVAAYVREQPEKIVKTGSKTIWLLSEATITVTILIILAGPKAAFSTAFLVLGLVFYWAGIALYIWARLKLGKYWSESIALRTGHKVVTDGPYKYFTHTIYIAIAIALTGAGLILQSPWGLAGTYLLTVPLLVLRAKEEERLLKKFGTKNLSD